MKNNSEKKFSLPAVLLIAGIVLLVLPVVFAGAVVLYADGPENMSNYLPRCPVRELTGLSCAGCGTTRALHALLHGRFLDAFMYNVLLFPLLVFSAVLCARPKLALSVKTMIAFAGVVLLFTILRNIPCWPFELFGR